jgi:hypothetical protein
MANEKKSLVEEALLQMKNLEEAVTENAKGILASTMKEEISELVKESLSEEEEIISVAMEESSDMEKGSEMAEQEMELDIDDEEDEMDMELDMDSDDESEMEDEDEGEEMLMMDLPGDELEVDDEEEVLLPLDLTGASDEEILKVFKAMGEEDGIIVTQDGGDVTLKDEDADVEYKIQMESEEAEEEVVYEIEVSEEDMDEEWNEEMAEGGMDKGDQSKSREDYADYKGTDKGYHGKDGESHGDQSDSKADFMKEEDEEEYDHFRGAEKDDAEHIKDLELDMKDDAEHTEGEMEETQTHSNSAGRTGTRIKPSNYPKNLERFAQRNESLEKEVAQLREKNEEYRKALNIFKEKLNEVAVFNSNLAYATRLFTENTTTKQEKINILRRFDSVETLKESKGLYKTLKEEFDAKSAETIAESVSTKVSKTPAKGSSANLIESKTYENPQFMRMKDLMSKIIK